MVFLLNSIMLGIGLAMDAFSVSLANGLHEPYMGRGRMCMIAGVYAVFQYLMPMAGWICVHHLAGIFPPLQKMIPWIALILLVYIGGKMLLEAARERRRLKETGPADEERAAEGIRALSGTDLLLQGVATSIDALSVGFAIAGYTAAGANLCALVIGGVTFLIAAGGLMIGRKAGTRLSWKASVLGGLILIAIGLEIFLHG